MCVCVCVCFFCSWKKQVSHRRILRQKALFLGGVWRPRVAGGWVGVAAYGRPCPRPPLRLLRFLRPSFGLRPRATRAETPRFASRVVDRDPDCLPTVFPLGRRGCFWVRGFFLDFGDDILELGAFLVVCTVGPVAPRSKADWVTLTVLRPRFAGLCVSCSTCWLACVVWFICLFAWLCNRLLLCLFASVPRLVLSPVAVNISTLLLETCTRPRLLLLPFAVTTNTNAAHSRHPWRIPAKMWRRVFG
jgi:hypothetical protein